MQLFTHIKVDWIGKKWYLISVSAALLTAGAVSTWARGGLKLGVDFTGGTIVRVRFSETPPVDRVRDALKARGLATSEIQRFDEPEKNQVQIRLPLAAEAEEVERGAQVVREALTQVYGTVGKPDFNQLPVEALVDAMREADVAQVKGKRPDQEIQAYYEGLARRLHQRRVELGILQSFDQLRDVEGVGDGLLASLRERFGLGNFSIISVESVGPKVGKNLRDRARDAVIFSLLGMLVYIGVRFRGTVYGVAAIIAIFHDVLVTLGFFSLTQQEISLTVVAALLTLVGYSVNDTIVIYDRIRENLKLMRREDLVTIVNTSINQTMSRTILTSGMTFLAVVSLFLFGGEVLRGFSFALVVGIIVGSYSTLAIASPLVVWWYQWRGKPRAKARPQLRKMA
ncbi:MAG: protein translocase subunit SecF [Acidobacteria bacterium]|nr:protein translocase subunit SecF [Acidobacteriota bacterium]